jgi:TRAP-type C4-dicarboxylate transport system, small permease component
MRVINWITRYFEETVAGVAFCVMLIVVVFNVAARFCFGYSFSFAEEVAYIGFAYSVCLGACILYKRNAMITIDVIVGLLPQRLQRAMGIFNTILLLAANLVLCWLSLKLSIGAWTRPTAALRLPYTIIDMAATIAFLLMSYYSVRFLVDAVRGREAPPPPAIEERG